MDTMPVALAAFFESDSFEDAIRSAIGLGGDSDTIAAITGSIAEAYYGVPEDIWPLAHNTDRGFPAVLSAVLQ
jgi:type I restriction enzyme M protein